MINPYTIDIPDERLTAIRIRMEAYDWSQLPDTGGWRSGVGVDDLRRLVDYWRDRYDWRKVERRLNELPHFTADIEGERLHFVHMHGDGSKPPLLLLHGWPGSFLEFERLLATLRRQEAGQSGPGRSRPPRAPSTWSTRPRTTTGRRSSATRVTGVGVQVQPLWVGIG